MSVSARRSGGPRAWIRALTAAGVLLACFAPASAQTRPGAREVAFDGLWALATPVGSRLHAAGGGEPPLTREGRALYLERQARRARGDDYFDGSARCKPIGFPRVLWDGAPFDLQIQPRLVFFGYTWNRNHRIVAFSADPPALQIPRYYGNSTARWDGDALVVRSRLFPGTTLLDASGLPHSENMALTERYHALEGGHRLDVRITIDDPAWYTRRWDVHLRFDRVPDGRIAEDVCETRSEFYRSLLEEK